MKIDKPKEPENMTAQEREKWEKLHKAIVKFQLLLVKPELN